MLSRGNTSIRPPVSSGRIQSCNNPVISLFLVFVFLALPALQGLIFAVDNTTTRPYRFGNPLYEPTFYNSPLDCGNIYFLSPSRHATMNLEDTGDLLGFNPELFHPDLVTAGRSVFISSFYSGPRGTRAFYRGRPFRDIRTGRSDLSQIPPALVGGVRSVHWGCLNGAIAPGVVIDIRPVELHSELPLTLITYREGFYDFAPVEFIHTRQVSEHSYLTAGGLLPSSDGRFANAHYSGHILHGQYQLALGASSSLDLAYMSSLNRTEIPFSVDGVNKTRRGDQDIMFIHNIADDAKIEVAAYRTESTTRIDTVDDYGRELGFRISTVFGHGGSYIRLCSLDGRLPGGTAYRLTEFEGSIGLKGDIGPAALWFVVGGYGWLPKKVGMVATTGWDVNIKRVGTFFIQLKQAVDPHSPEMMLAEYRTGRPRDDIEPVWELRPELPVMGTDKPVTVQRGGRFGIRRDVYFGELEVAGFGCLDIHPVIWGVKHDSTLTLVNLARRYYFGWQTGWLYDNAPYRVMVSLVNVTHRERSAVILPVTCQEPNLRLFWEAGYHRSFWDNDFEVDFSMSCRYFSDFDVYNPAEGNWETIGGAYPLDFKFTARIRHFNFYYGLHNWNSYQYYLVPGYKMMHREEYWGFNWLFLM